MYGIIHLFVGILLLFFFFFVVLPHRLEKLVIKLEELLDEAPIRKKNDLIFQPLRLIYYLPSPNINIRIHKRKHV